MKPIISSLLLLLALASTVQADTRAELRSRLNRYFQDSTNAIYDTTVKNQVINIALLEYTASFPVQIDTARQTLAAGTRFYALPTNCGGIVTSVHKFNNEFTELKEIPSDSIPPVKGDVPEFYSVKGRLLVIYPPPTGVDSVFYFYNRISPTLDSTDHECELSDWLEEPIVMLAAAKLWMMTDLRSDLAGFFWNWYQQTAAALTRTVVQEAKKQ